MNKGDECFMKIYSQLTFAGLALFITGSSLLYSKTTSIIKADSTQNILSSLQISTQRDRTSVKQAMRDTFATWIPRNTR
jgi:D-alanyl-D-alanine carboxypeptidase